MRKFVLSTVLAVLLLAAGASAADAQFYRARSYYYPSYSYYYTTPTYSYYYAPGPATTFVPQSTTSYYYTPDGAVVPAASPVYTAPVTPYYYTAPTYGSYYYYPRWRWQ